MAIGALMGLVFLAAIAFWVWMLVDAIKRKDKQYKKYGGKVLWIILLILFGVLAAIIYYLLIKRQFD